MAPSHLTIVFMCTAGQNGENLGSDEAQIVLFVYLLYDVGNNKVSKTYFPPLSSENLAKTQGKLSNNIGHNSEYKRSVPFVKHLQNTIHCS